MFPITLESWLAFIVLLVIGAIVARALKLSIPIFPLAMAVLTEDRDTPSRDGKKFSYPVAASKFIFSGSLIVLNSSGYAEPGTAATGKKALGRAAAQIDNSAGQDGDLSVPVDEGIFRFANSAGGDEIALADVGNSCFIVDDQTVAKTSNGGTRSVAGYIRDVDSNGVWVDIRNNVSADGDLVAANNLSDVASAITARANLGFDTHTAVVTRRHKQIAGGAAYTVTTADGDALIQTATDTAVITLPDAAAANKGLRVTVQNSGADGAALISVSPHTSDKIIGTVAAVSFGGVADKDIQNTKATANKGDYVTLESDGVDSWYVVGGVGVWASEG